MDSKDMQDIIRHLEADPVVEVRMVHGPQLVWSDAKALALLSCLQAVASESRTRCPAGCVRCEERGDRAGHLPLQSRDRSATTCAALWVAVRPTCMCRLCQTLLRKSACNHQASATARHVAIRWWTITRQRATEPCPERISQLSPGRMLDSSTVVCRGQTSWGRRWCSDT